jgi:hypothetical protein
MDLILIEDIMIYKYYKTNSPINKQYTINFINSELQIYY